MYVHYGLYSICKLLDITLEHGSLQIETKGKLKQWIWNFWELGIQNALIAYCNRNSYSGVICMNWQNKDTENKILW